MRTMNFALRLNDFCFALLMVTVFVITIAAAVAGAADLGRGGDVRSAKSGQLRVALRGADATELQAARAGARK
ncbi:MAG: hypothetical protein JO133_14000 [Burkholderiaceae bacterium]|nr:hypothetical protein [Burkholderiaceae bacterium]